jgi:hypothetical protein
MGGRDIRALLMVGAVAVVIAGCAAPGAGQSAGPTSPSQPSGAAPSPDATVTATPGGAGASSAPTTPPTSAPNPTSAPPSAGWAVTLTGKQTGAGAHTGTAAVTCFRTTTNGIDYWNVTMVDVTAAFGEVTDFSLTSEPGRVTLRATAGGMETGSWMMSSDTGDATLTATAGSTTHISARGAAGGATMEFEADCTDVY